MRSRGAGTGGVQTNVTSGASTDSPSAGAMSSGGESGSMGCV